MTATLNLTEVILDAAIAKLKTGMPQRIATINAQKNDGIILGAPSDSDYYIGGIAHLPNAPAVIVTEGPKGGSFAEEGPHAFSYTDELLIYILEQDADRQQLARRLLRQARAVIETLWDDPPQEALDGSAYTLKPTATQPGRVFNPEDDTMIYRQFYIVVFTATQAEN